MGNILKPILRGLYAMLIQNPSCLRKPPGIKYKMNVVFLRLLHAWLPPQLFFSNGRRCKVLESVSEGL